MVWPSQQYEACAMCWTSWVQPTVRSVVELDLDTVGRSSMVGNGPAELCWPNQWFDSLIDSRQEPYNCKSLQTLPAWCSCSNRTF
jgi:hypothetical protein